MYRVRSLSIVLEDTEIVLSTCETDEKQKVKLQTIATSCHEVLLDLEKTIGKYSESEHSGGNIGKKLRRVWKRLKWEPEDIKELRDRLTLNVTLLSGYIGQISR